MTAVNHFIDEKEVLQTRRRQVSAYKRMLRLVQKSSRRVALASSLARNVDKSCVVSLDQAATVDPDRVYSGVSLQQFQNYHIKEAEQPMFRTFVKYPQRLQKVYNCVTDQEQSIKPPPIVREVASATQDKYATIWA